MIFDPVSDKLLEEVIENKFFWRDIMISDIAEELLARRRASQWVSVNDRLPKNEDGLWSEPVIAMSETGDIFRLSCMGSYWQRTQAFIDSGSEKITHWMPIPPTE